jgi:uncharacterized protein (DUF433 family)
MAKDLKRGSKNETGLGVDPPNMEFMTSFTIGSFEQVGNRQEISKQKGEAESVVETFDRITRIPGVMGGKPCIKGSRMTVGMIVAQVAGGATFDELIDDFPELAKEDILQAIGYAGWLASDMIMELEPAA